MSPTVKRGRGFFLLSDVRLSDLVCDVGCSILSPNLELPKFSIIKVPGEPILIWISQYSSGKASDNTSLTPGVVTQQILASGKPSVRYASKWSDNHDNLHPMKKTSSSILRSRSPYSFNLTLPCSSPHVKQSQADCGLPRLDSRFPMSRMIANNEIAFGI